MLFVQGIFQEQHKCTLEILHQLWNCAIFWFYDKTLDSFTTMQLETASECVKAKDSTMLLASLFQETTVSQLLWISSMSECLMFVGCFILIFQHIEYKLIVSVIIVKWNNFHIVGIYSETFWQTAIFLLLGLLHWIKSAMLH